LLSELKKNLLKGRQAIEPLIVQIQALTAWNTAG
jgi:hypothetical protein